MNRFLSAYEDIIATVFDNIGRMALPETASGGHLAIVDRLLARKAEVTAEDNNGGGRAAFEAAAICRSSIRYNQRNRMSRRGQVVIVALRN